jgi:hypothetical protein
MAQYSEEWFYPTGQLATNQRAIVFGPGDDNAIAPIFSDPGLTTPLANPTVTDENGMLEFYAADGTYWIWVGPTTGGNGIEITLGASPDNPVLSVNGVAPDGAGNVELTAADLDAQPITTINAAGDLYVGTGDNATTRLPAGAEGEVLTITAGVPSWEAGGGGAVDSVNGQTGVVVLDATDVGADPAGSAAAAAAASQPLATIDAAGDLYLGTGNNTTTRLPIGAPGEVLTVVAGTASWEPAPADAVDSVNGQTGVVVLDAGDVGADPAGSAAAAAAASQPLATIDALGDLYVGTGPDATARLPRGANGEVLATNDAEPTGLEWIPAPGGAVDSVNGQTGVVVLDAGDVGAVAEVATPGIVYGTDGAGAPDTYDVEDLTTTTIEFTDDRQVLTAGNGTARWYNREGVALTIIGAWVSVGVVPTDAAILVDVNVNGTTIYTTQGNRPTVAAGTNGGAISATPDVTALAVGDYLTVDIDQIGSTIAGGQMTVGIVVAQNL